MTDQYDGQVRVYVLCMPSPCQRPVKVVKLGKGGQAEGGTHYACVCDIVLQMAGP